MRSTIKVFTSSLSADYLRPWTKCDGETCSGSGFAIEGQHILTNSHVVRDHQLLQVQRHDRPGKWIARLVVEGVQCDLALLAVDDERFWDDLPLQACTDDVPGLQHIVTAIGYPLGGENLSVTRGVVSRIDLLDYTFLDYAHGERLLVLQIDAAINPGNSGGPVFSAEGRVVGVAFAGLDEADSIGYVIPMPVVRLFLRSFELHGSFGQLPSLGLSFQATENRSLRRMLQLDPDGRSGLLVAAIAPLMPAHAAGLAPGDVVMKLDGLDMAEDGTVQAMPGLRLPWEYCVTRHPTGHVVELDILRHGRPSKVKVALVPEPRAVAFHDGVDASPSYVIVGGLVFLELSLPLIQSGFMDTLSEREAQAAGRLIAKIGEPRKQAGERLIVLASILESELTISYEATCAGRQLTKFNGGAMLNLQQLATAVQAASSAPFLKFEFGDFSAVLDGALVKKTEAQVLRAHDVAAWCSDDVNPKGGSILSTCLTAFSMRSPAAARAGTGQHPLPPLQ